MAEQEQDRTEPATPFRLEEARKRGQVAKSLEVNSFLIVAGVLAIFYFAGDKMVTGLLAVNRNLLANIHSVELDENTVLILFQTIVEQTFRVFWPLALAIVVIAILANFFQTGPVFSFHPIKPDINKINPVQGLKRFFSTRLLFESVKNIVKLVLFGAIVYFTLKALLPKLLTMMDLSPETYGAALLDHTRYLVSRLVLAMLLIALLDLQYSRWDYAKRLRMSRRELKEEIKRREGDPKIRARIRQLQREAMKRAQSLKRVPDADVLITNPTRLAVALKYDRSKMAAPHVISKGAGDLAAKMREVAVAHNIPIVENKSIAQSLFSKVDIDAGIPEELYPMVAKIMVWAFAMSRRQAGTTPI